jgi:hypothetical protein
MTVRLTRRQQETAGLYPDKKQAFDTGLAANKLAEVITLLTPVREVIVSNLGRDTG